MLGMVANQWATLLSPRPSLAAASCPDPPLFFLSFLPLSSRSSEPTELRPGRTAKQGRTNLHNTIHFTAFSAAAAAADEVSVPRRRRLRSLLCKLRLVTQCSLSQIASQPTSSQLRMRIWHRSRLEGRSLRNFCSIRPAPFAYQTRSLHPSPNVRVANMSFDPADGVGAGALNAR